jgi:hypothetical protein
MRFVISFPSPTFSNISDAIRFADEFTKFKKVGIVDSVFYDPYSDGLLQYLKNLPKPMFWLEEPPLDMNGRGITYRMEKEEQLEIFFFSIKNIIKELYLENLLQKAAKENFSFAYLENSNSHWQNEIMISNYQVLNRPYKHLPQIWDSRLSPILGPIIDISVNPGHQKETYHMRLMAAPEMWFGPSAWQYFDKDRVKSFPFALDISEIIPDVVHVKLFDYATPDYEAPEILKLQKHFREWTKMDEVEKLLEEKLAEVRAQSNSPVTAISTKVDIRHPDSPKTSTEEWYIVNKKKKK